MFTSFNVMVSNTFGNKTEHGYNSFLIDDIVRSATNNVMGTDEIAETGIVILMIAEWKCDLDLDNKACVPQFAYHRLDTIMNGFSFMNVWYTKDYSTRMLMKRYGIRILFVSLGSATKKSINSVIFIICSAISTLIISVILTYYIFKGLQLICPHRKAKQLRQQ
eukprot:UN03817